MLNNALSGIDMALWDIKGKLAGMPLPTCSVAAAESPRPSMSMHLVVTCGKSKRRSTPDGAGVRYIRCQVAVPMPPRTGSPARLTARSHPPHLRLKQNAWDPSAYVRIVPRLFAELRSVLGDAVELLHDIHERLPPIMAIGLAKELEQYRLFFLEDPFPTGRQAIFPLLRQQSAVPIAMGELYVNVTEYLPLIQNQLIDFIRVHLSPSEGSPRHASCALCEFFGVAPPGMGPGDVSPVGHAANLHLDLAVPNFGIQEGYLSPERTREVFPGTPEIRDGMLWANDRPGLGIYNDETAPARYPFPEHPLNGAWPPVRLPDGTVQRP